MMEVGWFPVELQTLVRWCNVIGSLIGVIALVMLMSWNWQHMHGIGQRMRYMALLGYALLISGGTLERMADHTPYSFGYRTIFTTFLTIFLLVALVITWRDAYRDHRKKSPRV